MESIACSLVHLQQIILQNSACIIFYSMLYYIYRVNCYIERLIKNEKDVY